jgi:hypothetical protein
LRMQGLREFNDAGFIRDRKKCVHKSGRAKLKKRNAMQRVAG